MSNALSYSKGHYINGHWQAGKGSSFPSKNPATNECIWVGQQATHAEIEEAFGAASRALNDWHIRSFEEKCSYLERFAKAVEQKKQALTLLISQENGKPLWEALTEVNAVTGKVKLSIEAYQERTKDKQVNHLEAQAYLRYKPHGVVAVLGPFNFPAHLSNGHIIPALLAGNTIVYKPSELTPAVAELIMTCWQESGIPDGVINCVQGNADVAKHLLNQAIQGVYFTGSYQAGLAIHQHFSGRPEVILALEMGGNNPLVVDHVHHIDAAVYQALLSCFITAGQRCTCARRLIVPNSNEGDTFLKRFLAGAKQLQVASYDKNPEPFMGPVISSEHAQRFLKAQEILQQNGGVSMLEMQPLLKDTGLLSPGIIDVSSASNLTDEEIFAPFVQVHRYDEFEEALQISNHTQYGLAAGLLSDSKKHYEQFYQVIRAGLINWNRPTTGAASNLPFGGIGHSGNHRPSAYFAADYCAYPIASLETAELVLPAQQLPGMINEIK